MITHYAYINAYPLPSFPPLRIHNAVEPTIAGRVHLIAKPEDNATQRVVSVSELVKALSKTEWSDTAYIADQLNVTAQTVVDRMARSEMVALTEWRRVGRGGRYEWRLK